MKQTDIDKIVTRHQDTGECEVNVELIKKIWNDKFSISEWKDQYTLLIHKRGEIYRLRCGISSVQAQEIIRACGLLQIRSHVFNYGSAYHKKEFVEKEIERIQKIIIDKGREIALLRRYVEVNVAAINNQIFKYKY